MNAFTLRTPRTHGGTGSGEGAARFAGHGEDEGAESGAAAVDAAGRAVASLGEVDVPPGATSLDVSDNRITTLDAGASMRGLTSLVAARNPVARLGRLTHIAGLRELRLPNCELRSLSGIETLRELRSLDVSFNGLAVLDGLEACTHLEHVAADGNDLTDLPRCKTLTNLRSLTLRGNRIQSLDRMAFHLPSCVACLDVSDNFLDDICTLRGLATLASLTQLEVSDNPFEVLMFRASASFVPYLVFLVPALNTINGVELGKDGRERAMEMLSGESGLDEESVRVLRGADSAALVALLAERCGLNLAPERRARRAEYIGLLEARKARERGAGTAAVPETPARTAAPDAAVRAAVPSGAPGAALEAPVQAKNTAAAPAQTWIAPPQSATVPPGSEPRVAFATASPPARAAVDAREAAWAQAQQKAAEDYAAQAAGLRLAADGRDGSDNSSEDRPRGRHSRRSSAGERGKRSHRDRRSASRRRARGASVGSAAGHSAHGDGGGSGGPSAAELAKTVKHVAEMRRYFKVWVKTEQRRRVAAALAVQRVWRGFRTRWRVSDELSDSDFVRSRARRGLSARDTLRVLGPETAAFRRRMRRQYPPLSSIVCAPRPARPGPQGAEDRAVTRIQALLRGVFVRSSLVIILLHRMAATAIQAQWRGHRVRAVRSGAVLLPGVAGIARGPHRPTYLRDIVAPMLQPLEAEIRALRRTAEAAHRQAAEAEAARKAQDEALQYLWDEVSSLRRQARERDARDRVAGARRIQSFWRRRKAQRTLTSLRRDYETFSARLADAASTVQKIVRGRLARRHVAERRALHDAAAAVQTASRTFLAQQRAAPLMALQRRVRMLEERLLASDAGAARGLPSSVLRGFPTTTPGSDAGAADEARDGDTTPSAAVLSSLTRVAPPPTLAPDGGSGPPGAAASPSAAGHEPATLSPAVEARVAALAASAAAAAIGARFAGAPSAAASPTTFLSPPPPVVDSFWSAQLAQAQQQGLYYPDKQQSSRSRDDRAVYRGRRSADRRSPHSRSPRSRSRDSSSSSSSSGAHRLRSGDSRERRPPDSSHSRSTDSASRYRRASAGVSSGSSMARSPRQHGGYAPGTSDDFASPSSY